LAPAGADVRVGDEEVGPYEEAMDRNMFSSVLVAFIQFLFLVHSAAQVLALFLAALISR